MLESSIRPEKGLLSDGAPKLQAIAGIVAPISFTTVVIVLGFMQPGYNHVSHTISELGAVGASNAGIQNANFVVTGILTLAFAFGLHGGISGGKGSRIGPSLVALWGLALVASGFFQLDPKEAVTACTSTPSISTCAPGLHDVAGLTGFAASGAAAVVLSRRLRTDPQWRSYASFSVVAGLLMIVFLGGFMLSFPHFPAYVGVVQRLMVGTILLWTEVMAIRLAAISRPSELARATGAGASPKSGVSG